MRHRFPGLLRDTTAAGTLRWRVRKEGESNKKIPIPCGPGEPGFHEHYYAARAGEKLEIIKPKAPKKGTLDELCDRFLAWMEGRVASGDLSPLTLSNRRTGLKQAREVLDPDGDRMGALDADLPSEAFVHILDTFGGRSGAAHTCLKALRAAYTWGEDRGFPKNSPVFRVKSGYKQGDGATPWSGEDVARYLSRHPAGSMARLWFCLAYATGGRIGDSPRLGAKNEVVRDGVRHVEWQPGKKGSAFVSVPMHGMLKEELKNHKPRDTYLVTEYGRPFASSGSLDNRVRKWIVAAGLVDSEGKVARSQHGIRKGVAELMAEAGATEYELMATFGWTETKTASVYTKKADRRKGAASAAARRSAAESGPRLTGRGPDEAKKSIKSDGFVEHWQPVGESNPSFQVENLAS